MLEQTSLLLHPWVRRAEASWVPPDATRALWVRPIANAASRERIGFASLEPLPGWRAWLGMKTIHVFEHEDACLLMTLHRPWGVFRMWRARDAEEYPVGSIYRETLLDGRGRRLARMTQGQAASENALLSPAGHKLAGWQRTNAHETIFHFNESGEMNPFARMMALAAVLVLPPLP